MIAHPANGAVFFIEVDSDRVVISKLPFPGQLAESFEIPRQNLNEVIRGLSMARAQLDETGGGK